MLIFCCSVLSILLFLRFTKNNSLKRVCVVVLGDVGRSPRMQNHALCFAKAGFHVDLVGFGGKKLFCGKINILV